ncbi:chorismate synthase 2, chloroplastic-like isoform X2 [Apium graveolens]|uniref:chorismate synthase 2, chloroplastic-like isoform X2 n=1 Tax=Apium graveolens TaxID=4045 RepID=UPI003D78FC69
MQIELDKRRPGQIRITTLRKEPDTCTIYSGVSEDPRTSSQQTEYSVTLYVNHQSVCIFSFNRKVLAAALFQWNWDLVTLSDSSDAMVYNELSIAYRSSHADSTYDFKYGVRSIQHLKGLQK